MTMRQCSLIPSEQSRNLSDIACDQEAYRPQTGVIHLRKSSDPSGKFVTSGQTPRFDAHLAEDRAAKPPVLVLGWVPRIVTAIARSLHGDHIAVDVADFVARPVSSSAIREGISVPDPNVFPREFVNRVRAFIRQKGHDTLIPADDIALAAVTEHYDVFRELVNVACPPPQVTRLVLDKRSTLDIALQCGIRVPKTVPVRSSGELLGLVDTLPFPWVLKPAEKEQHEEFKSCMFRKADEIRRMFPTPCDFSPAMLLQEYCEGAGVGIEMLMHRGECLAVFQHRRLKELPHNGGFAVTAIAELPDPTLVQASCTLLREMHWDGVAMVEYKINPDNGQATLMEVNGRYWGTLALAIFAGVNFPLYHWKLIHGQTPKIPADYSVGTRWRWTAGYMARLHWLFVSARAPGPARRVLMRSLLDIPADFHPSIHDSMFEVSDPNPAVAELLHDLKFLFLYDLRALAKVRARRHAPSGD